MREYVEAAPGPRRFNLGLFTAFSFTGVVLAILGLYGLVSYTVSQRQREIGLRMAVGASERDIRRMILYQAAILGLSGVALGCCITAIAQRLIAQFDWDATIALSPAIAATALLMLLMLLAAWLPTNRAARTPPTIALR
jgi:putative ABC transport system permease protein